MLQMKKKISIALNSPQDEALVRIYAAVEPRDPVAAVAKTKSINQSIHHQSIVDGSLQIERAGWSPPEDIVVLVDLLALARTLQDAAVADHRAARALGGAAALPPVVQQLPVGGGVEHGQSVRQGWKTRTRQPMRRSSALLSAAASGRCDHIFLLSR